VAFGREKKDKKNFSECFYLTLTQILTSLYAPLSDSSARTPSYSTGEGGPWNMGSASAALGCAFLFAEDARQSSNAERFFQTVSVE
jgi:hypothetical protein